MAFSFDLSDELRAVIRVLAKKDKVTAEALDKKIKEIIGSDEITIDRYKNLRYGLSEYKRAHVAKSFILMFRVFKKEKHILFDRFQHHDDAYRR